MDLLESILRTAKAEKYLQNFQNENIDVETLQLLNDLDLQLIGVDDENTRGLLLKQTANLNLKSRIKTDVLINADFVNMVLSQISQQLLLHTANLYCASDRSDVVNCNIKLDNGTKCLLKCLNDFENQIKHTMMVKKNKKKGHLKNIVIVSTLGLTCLIVFKYCFNKQL